MFPPLKTETAEQLWVRRAEPVALIDHCDLADARAQVADTLSMSEAPLISSVNIWHVHRIRLSVSAWRHACMFPPGVGLRALGLNVAE